MLVELHIRDVGVIADVRLTLGPGMTAVTGETGAGKTMLVEAVELLGGGRADSGLVRPGAEEANVEAPVDADRGGGVVGPAPPPPRRAPGRGPRRRGAAAPPA